MGGWADAVLAALAAAGIKIGVLVSSSIGGFASLRFFEGETMPDGTVQPLSIGQKWSIAIPGAAMGYFLAPATVEWFSLTDKGGHVEVGLGLLIAFFGMSMASAIGRALKELNLKAILESWLTPRGPRPPAP